MSLDRYAVFRIPDFRRALGSKFFLTLGLQMQRVIIGWQIFQLTHDPLALGLVGLAEALPYMGCLLWAGHQADRLEKRRLILVAEGGLLICAVAFWWLARAPLATPAPLYLVVGLTGLFRSLLWPATAAYVDAIVPKAIYAQAAGWNSTQWQLGAIVGPLLGGWLYAAAGVAWAYAGVVAWLALAVWYARRLAPHPPENRDGSRTVPISRGLWEGVRFVMSRQVIVSALALDMFAVLFGSVTAILPFFAERFQAGAVGLGLLNAALPAGALVMALHQAHRPPFHRTGLALLLGVALFGAFTIGFALAPWFWLAALCLAVAGAADNVSVVIRASVLQAMTPNRLRGRVSSVNGLFISSSNEIGAFESGVAAKLLGVVPSVLIGGCATLVCVAVTAWRAPSLRRLALQTQAVPSRDGV
ncbi:MAG: MFS transporter [Candidatus Omnitrophica bacterium]|nr:MFS transporter [Candidatus Omnitrophota bacterium]